MPKDETLTRVEHDISTGDLGKARDRLQGLIRAYPEDMDIRDRLGEVFWRLDYPGMAGRYWYLLPRDSDVREQACAAFEAECGGETTEIYRRLKMYRRVRPLFSQVDGRAENAKDELDRIEKELEEIGWLPSPEERNGATTYANGHVLVTRSAPGRKHVSILIGPATIIPIVLILLAVLIIGAATIVGWVL